MNGNEMWELGNTIWTEAHKLYTLVCKDSYHPLEYDAIMALMNKGIEIEQKGLELMRVESAMRKVHPDE